MLGEISGAWGMCFDDDAETLKDPETAVESLLDQASKTERSPMYAVVLHNDPLNGVDYVPKVIRSVFGYTMPRCVWLMLRAHFTGRCTLWVGALAEANEKRAQMIAFGPDPNMVEKGAQALTVTVELAA